MSCLWVNERVVAEAEVAAGAEARTKGLLGREGMNDEGSAADSVLVLEPAGWIHTLGMRFAIDVAYVDRRGRVLSVKTMKPWRMGLPRLRSRRVLEAAAGSFARWNLKAGDLVEIKSEQANFSESDPHADQVASGRTAQGDSIPGDKAQAGNAEARGGAIVLVATPIGNLGDLSPRAVETLAAADIIACEDTRRTGRLLELSGIQSPKLVCLNEHTEEEVKSELIARAQHGQLVAVATDAGSPGISDPPGPLVSAAHAAGITVSVIPGPSAVTAALSLSGLNTSRFTFEGFLPRKGTARSQRLAALAREPRTIVLFEAPHRLAHTLGDLAQTIGADRPVALARELTKLHEEVVSATIGELAKQIAEGTIPAKGEFALVIQGSPEPPEPTDEAILAALVAERADGATRSEAAQKVADAYGIPKRKVYALAVEPT